MWWIVGLEVGNTPLYGGVLVPTTDVVVPTHTDAQGKAVLAYDWPDLGPEATLVHQAWVRDASAVGGYAATVGLIATAP